MGFDARFKQTDVDVDLAENGKLVSLLHDVLAPLALGISLLHGIFDKFNISIANSSRHYLSKMRIG